MSDDLSARAVIAALDRDDILQAFDEIDREEVPPRRRSKKFCAEHQGRHYPPKLVISFASGFRYADEPELSAGLDPADFAGGPQSNQALRRLGFKIVECSCGGLAGARDPGVDADSGIGPRITRVVVDGRAAMKQKKALECLADVFKAMRRAGARTDIVTTPGGFMQLDLTLKAQPLGWQTPVSVLSTVSQAVEQSLNAFMTALGKLDPPASYMTLGIDCMLPNEEHEYANAQLVATIDLGSMTIVAWTGKSYPTISEEKELMHVTDLGSHLQKLGKWKCIVLGCHDLNMFSPRSVANRDPKSPRGKRADEFTRQAVAFEPAVVLQHPHTTDTPNIWMGGWSGVNRSLKPITYASGICYFWPGHGKKHRATLDEVLNRTRFGNVCDYVWRGPGRVKKHTI